jgi:hypothetical protein
LQIKTKIVSCHTANSKPVKHKVNSTVILPPLVFPGIGLCLFVLGEVVLHVGINVLMEIDKNRALILGDLLGVLGQQLRPCHIHLLNIIIIYKLLIKLLHIIENYDYY